MLITRRSFLVGLIAAPIIVKADSLMKIVVPKIQRHVFIPRDIGLFDLNEQVWRIVGYDQCGDLTEEVITVEKIVDEMGYRGQIGIVAQSEKRFREIVSIAAG